ncbi:uncharacterized protein B0I36DRAFT_326220 [Microdochium trichocladiopsis]|uniref:Uncharacterized protein n=1 Tax=Microdochium trichocladiopsis TaxID=1682393 RepID=A0A9P8Y7U3_9PEZI|nr:uncharacterized protein B0I36DRAFT_326220 [Microdochium trichocladiopsis]KAH7029677.1 hypothetical protein B0I36DRAFT_326220 [Microdochium trichocladiopsis]
MRTAPEGEALDILFRLRALGNAQSVLKSLRGSISCQYQPSTIQATRAVSPTDPFDARVQGVDMPDNAIPRKYPYTTGRIATYDISSKQSRHSAMHNTRGSSRHNSGPQGKWLFTVMEDA